MNTITRTLALAGAGAAAALAVAGPAQAAPAAGDSHSATRVGNYLWSDGTSVVGTYGSPYQCEQTGQIGVVSGQWSDYDCYPVQVGFRGGAFVLEVSYYGNIYDGGDCWGDGGHFHPFRYEPGFAPGWRGGHHGGHGPRHHFR